MPPKNIWLSVRDYDRRRAGPRPREVLQQQLWEAYADDVLDTTARHEPAPPDDDDYGPHF